MPSLIASLTSEGAIVEAVVGVSQARAAALLAANLPTPQPIQLWLLVDTGASATCIQEGLLAPLGLLPTGSTPIHTPSTGGSPIHCDQYDVSISFPGMVPFTMTFPTVSVIECQPLTGTILGLLGRDILKHAAMSYNPLVQAVTISF